MGVTAAVDDSRKTMGACAGIAAPVISYTTPNVICRTLARTMDGEVLTVKEGCDDVKCSGTECHKTLAFTAIRHRISVSHR